MTKLYDCELNGKYILDFSKKRTKEPLFAIVVCPEYSPL